MFRSTYLQRLPAAREGAGPLPARVARTSGIDRGCRLARDGVATNASVETVSSSLGVHHERLPRLALGCADESRDGRLDTRLLDQLVNGNEV